MTTYVLRDGILIEKRLAPPIEAPISSGVQVIRDTPGYLSPCGTGWIEGRRARRDDLARNNCIEADRTKRDGYQNERFAAKHGLPFNPDGKYVRRANG